MKKRFNFIKALIHIIEGAIVGIGAILPGVSGGVLCVSFGMYEPVMELLTEPKKALKKNYDIFIPFLLGWVLGYVLFAGIVYDLLKNYSSVTLMLFFGLVCGTLPELFKKSEEADRKASWLPLIISLAVSYVFFHILNSVEVVNGSSEAINIEANIGFFEFMFCGFMWGVSLILPGLSSSSVLTYLGFLQPLMGGIKNFDMTVIIPYLLGILVTVLLFAKLVKMLFNKHYALISRVILGFVISSSLKALPNEFGGGTMIVSIICFALGFAVAFAMDRVEKRQAQKNGG